MRSGRLARSVVVASLALLGACHQDADEGGGVTDAELQQACAHGVSLCKDDPTWGAIYGAEACDAASLDAAYAGCDASCRQSAAPAIHCQLLAPDCDAFAACVQ